ncbi:MAG: hypothetical protein EBZ59_10695 [Planctomycetia bacterium]|nr:hypothetical protein [Planctomycetia bacterium]
MTHPGQCSLRGGTALALATVLACTLPSAARGQAVDRVRLTDKTEISGEIVGLSPGDVDIKKQGAEDVTKVPIDQVAAVSFGGEPDTLRNARNLLLRQQPADALEELGKIEQAELDGASDNVLAEVAFVKAAAAARRAAATGADLAEGERGIREFIQKHPRSHHLLRSHEILGDLLVRAGRFDDAAAAYAVLEKGPPSYRLRAALAKAGSCYEQKKYAEAEREYTAATKTQTDPKDGASARQKREAEVGLARSLSRQGKADDAVNRLLEVVRGADPTKDVELLGRVYAVLGDAYRTAGKDQDALIAFLTVDLVYNEKSPDPENHSEALYNLVQLWQKAQQPERAREARQTLESIYPDSRWTKALAAESGKG